MKIILILIFFIFSSCISKTHNNNLKELETYHYQELTKSISQFTDALNDKQKKELSLYFNHSHRISGFCYVYAHCNHVPGLKIGNLNGKQKRNLYQLLITAYDLLGYHQIVDIINRELILEEIELANRRSPIRYKIKSPNNKKWQPPIKRTHDLYNIVIFGDIEKDAIWALRFEGHHLLLNLTFKKQNDKIFVSSTPTFMGASPAIIPTAPKNLEKYYPRWSKEQGQQLLYQDSLLAKKLIKSININQQKIAKWPNIPSATLAGGSEVPINYQEVVKKKLPHIKYQNLSKTSQLLLKELMNKILSRQKKSFLDYDNFYKTIKNAKISFAGNLDDDKEFYIRIQSNRFLFELLQTGNYTIESEIEANHIHSVLRDLTSDFDFNILQKHLDHHH